MKKILNKKVMGYIALAMVCVLAGTAIGLSQPAGAAETVVQTSPFTEAIAKVRDSVVGVYNYQVVNTYGSGYGYGYGNGSGSMPSVTVRKGAEYTLPGVSQSVILTRYPGRTPVSGRDDFRSLAAHGLSMAVFLSAGLLEPVYFTSVILLIIVSPKSRQ